MRENYNNTEQENIKEVNPFPHGKKCKKNSSIGRNLIGLIASTCLILTVLTLAYFEIISFPIALVGVFVSFVPVFISCCLSASDINEQDNKKSAEIVS